MTTESFYDQISPFYDLIYTNWEASISQQANQLSAIINACKIEPAKTVLDVSCGIGTQALGLAKLGFQVSASDLSSGEIERARREAKKRGLLIDFSVCDMRSVRGHFQREFDVVLSADNSIPHLLSDDEILGALRQFYSCTRLGGACILTVRDYDNEDLKSNVIKPYAVQKREDGKYLIFQVWEVDGSVYETSMYCVKDLKDGSCDSFVSRAKYYAISTTKLVKLMEEAGFRDVERRDGVFFQPVIVGIR